MFKPNTLFYSDGYKVGHKRMLAPNTNFLYGTWIPRSLKYIDKSITQVVSFGQQLTVRWLHDEFQENFFDIPIEKSMKFGKDMSLYLGTEYNQEHFRSLHKLGYLPIKIKSLPEGIETDANIPHMTFINTVSGYAWLTLYLETIISSLSWKSATSATLALQFKRKATKWVMKTDPDNAWFLDFACHDFSARGLDPFSMLASGLGHATSHRGSDTLIVIPGARYFYGESEDEVCINSVNASEHSVSTTKIFTVGEKQMILDWCKEFPTGILSIVADTFDLWKLITEYLTDPEVKDAILSRDGKLVIRPDSGDPVDIICGETMNYDSYEEYLEDKGDKAFTKSENEYKGVIELLWDIFGGAINDKGFKVLDSHIGAIYGDSINLDRQTQIYSRLSVKGFASTNIVLGVGSFTYQFNTRDTLGFAAKGSWFQTETYGKPCEHNCQEGSCISECTDAKIITSYNIFKDPITDDGTKKSLKGKCAVFKNDNNEYCVKTECSEYDEKQGILQIIYENGNFYNQTSLTEIRKKLNYGNKNIPRRN